LPIYAGDPVYGLIIIKKPWLVGKLIPRGTNASGLCGVIDEWELASPLFEGKYNDYGCIEDFPDSEQIIRDAISQVILPGLLPSAKFSDVLREEDVMAEYEGTVEDAAKTLEGLLKMVERERAFYVNRDDIVLPLGLWMAHKAAVDALIDLSTVPSEDDLRMRGLFLGVRYDTLPHGLFANASMLLHSMSNGRIALMPQAGKGSGSDDLTVQKALVKFVTERQQPVWED
jgi:hypothetical protein